MIVLQTLRAEVEFINSINNATQNTIISNRDVNY